MSMDPDLTLNQIRELIQAAKKDDAVYQEESGWMFDLIERLDNHMSRGGMLPDAWRPVTGLDSLQRSGGL